MVLQPQWQDAHNIRLSAGSITNACDDSFLSHQVQLWLVVFANGALDYPPRLK